MSATLYKDLKIKIIKKKEADSEAICLLQFAILTYRKVFNNKTYIFY